MSGKGSSPEASATRGYTMDNEDQTHSREHVIRLLELGPECVALRLEQIQDTIQRLHVCDLHLSQTAWVHFNKLQEQIKALQ